jgi:hypothetical protein
MQAEVDPEQSHCLTRRQQHWPFANRELADRDGQSWMKVDDAEKERIGFRSNLKLMKHQSVSVSSHKRGVKSAQPANHSSGSSQTAARISNRKCDCRDAASAAALLCCVPCFLFAFLLCWPNRMITHCANLEWCLIRLPMLLVAARELVL